MGAYGGHMGGIWGASWGFIWGAYGCISVTKDVLFRAPRGFGGP